jgi:hypothetical protein
VPKQEGEISNLAKTFLQRYIEKWVTYNLSRMPCLRKNKVKDLPKCRCFIASENKQAETNQ